ncbi:MAG TPA: DUF2867 domain-containing protein, partial [Acidimicrobiia bacterium]|nr:DUF2867 domain-containing protein [Acidimicrobiia bacterium]
MRILVTGATGYIGRRLIPRLLAAGHELKCFTRDPRRLSEAPWRQRVEIVKGDVLDSASIEQALGGCDAAFYLIHSMEEGSHDFSDQDRTAARTFRDAADRASLRRIVYLGGLGSGESMSKHLASRQEVGLILSDGDTPVTELRAAVIIGSGSVSFEMLRYLTEVLPVMVAPTWVRTRCQPIAVADVLDIMVEAIAEAGGVSHVREIGGPDRLTYQEMMQVYAQEACLPRRLIIPVPVLSPKLSSHWIGLVTPLPTAVAKPLVDSLRVEVTVSDNSYAEGIVGELTSYREAVAQALRRSVGVPAVWRRPSSPSGPAEVQPGDPVWAGGTVLVDEQVIASSAQPSDLYWAVSRIGGVTGYYAMHWAWALRGLIDSMVGGVGLRRGRRHPEDIRDG